MMNLLSRQFEVVIVGGGHAGIEAALAAARLHCSCLLITFDLAKIAELSCNPAVGGQAKGHLVREIDALGGQMAIAADQAGIQFRLLNRSKGPAVWGSRAQVDMNVYPLKMQQAINGQKNLWTLADEVTGLDIKNNRIVGVFTQKNGHWPCQAVVIATGTFLGGVVHVGPERIISGRWQEPASLSLADQLIGLGFKRKRLKTGTPPRLWRESLDLAELPCQSSDHEPRMFSFLSKAPALPQIECYITRTNENTHRLVEDNLTLSPFYSGHMQGAGPRYCPLLEEKVVRFPERTSHQIFLEPQSLDGKLIYPNGIFTGLPLKVQTALVRTMPGCHRAQIAQPGYAVEYDMFDPRDLYASLASKNVEGLFLAGQVNGTSGYEEAAGQGLLAGINAARFCQGLDPCTFDRSEAYLGVMIDDLITKGTEEPYRLFTSRAEYRLTLREDNADLRLTRKGRELGLVDDRRWEVFQAKEYLLAEAWQRLSACRLLPTPEFNKRLADHGLTSLRQPIEAAELLRRPEVDMDKLLALEPALEFIADLPKDVAEQLYIKARYTGYEERERLQVEQFRQKERIAIPPDFCYDDLPGLSREVQEKLKVVRPQNLGQAGRISGVTPAALTILALHLHKKQSAQN